MRSGNVGAGRVADDDAELFQSALHGIPRLPLAQPHLFSNASAGVAVGEERHR
jgi:hypothetical protein